MAAFFKALHDVFKDYLGLVPCSHTSKRVKLPIVTDNTCCKHFKNVGHLIRESHFRDMISPENGTQFSLGFFNPVSFRNHIGIGFSIPIDKVKKIAEELIEYGKVRDIWFGFKVQDINPMLASHLGLESLDGVLVNYVQKSSPSRKAGLQKMDIITEINGNYIRNTEDAEMAVSDISVGDKMKLKIILEKRKILNKMEILTFKQLNHNFLM